MHADEPFVFVSSFASGEKAGIHAFQFDAKTGTLKPQAVTTDVQHPFFITLSNDKRFLYAIAPEKIGDPDDEFVAAYAIEDHAGHLKRLNHQSTRGTASCYLDTDATGKAVVVANYSSGSVASYAVKPDGSMAEAESN